MHRVSISLAVAFASLALIDSARADFVYFVSKTTGGLYAFDTAGGGITNLKEQSTFVQPTALAMGPDGNLYVGDQSGGGSIRRYTMTNGGVSTIVTLSGTNPTFDGGPVSPTSIAFTPGGAMLVGRNPEKAFEGYPSGPVLEVVGWNGGSPTVRDYTSGMNLNYQTGLTVAPNGTLYASNTTYDIVAQPAALVGNVVKFNGVGAYQSVVAVDGTSTGALRGPSGLGILGNSLFIASTMNGKVYKTDLANLDTATNTIEFASTGGDYLGPLAMLASGGLLAGSVSGVSGLIYQFDANGDTARTFGGASYGQIGGIVAVPEPNLLTIAAMGAMGVTAWQLRRRRPT